MFGRAGDDSYSVDNSLDAVSEAGGSGIDTVYSSVSFSLAATARVVGAFERLVLTGTVPINGAGNALANTIVGNARANVLIGNAGNDAVDGGAGDDTITGGLGADRLTGGADRDVFVFNAPLSAANRDTIIDFSHAEDTFRLENGVMPALGGPGGLNGAFFFAGVAAHDANDHVIYNRASGALLYDSDGAGGHAAIQFATLVNKPVLAANDFAVI